MLEVKSKVLIVDDRAKNREELEHWIAKANINPADIVLVKSLEEASDAIDRMAFDVSIVDLSLKDDPNDRGGWVVGKRLELAGDGTAKALITAFGGNNGKIANEAHADYGFDYYIDRDESLRASEVRKWILERGLKKIVRLQRREEYISRVIELTVPPLVHGKPYSVTEWIVDLQSVFDTSSPGEVYTIMSNLMRGFMPIRHLTLGDGVFMNQSDGLLVMNCWSRGVGKPMMFVAASAKELSGVLNELNIHRTLLGVPARIEQGPVLLGGKWHYLWATTGQDHSLFDSVFR